MRNNFMNKKLLTATVIIITAAISLPLGVAQAENKFSELPKHQQNTINKIVKQQKLDSRKAVSNPKKSRSICKAICETVATAAVAKCAALTGGVAVTLCLAAVAEAKKECKKACDRSFPF